jgi:hypothetical protein
MGQCACAPSCTGKSCGDDGCGGRCGTCPQGQSCEAGSCTYPDVSFARDVFPLFSSCGGAGCHAGRAAQLDLDLATSAAAYRTLVGVDAEQCSGPKQRVTAGDVTGSYLLNKLTGIGMCSGSIMPKADGVLSAAQLDVIRAWIANGARND